MKSMPLLVQLRHLANHEVTLEGELPVADLDLDLRDEMLRLDKPVAFHLTAELLDDSLLVRGTLEMVLDCECVRCLKPFQKRIELSEWTCHLALKGEESVPVVDDCVDLTPQIREDILLAFPAHPVCNPACGGLAGTNSGSKKNKAEPPKSNPSAWAELDKLKIKS